MLMSLYCNSCLMRPVIEAVMSSLAVWPHFCVQMLVRYLGDTHSRLAKCCTLRLLVSLAASSSTKRRKSLSPCRKMVASLSLTCLEMLESKSSEKLRKRSSIVSRP